MYGTIHMTNGDGGSRCGHKITGYEHASTTAYAWLTCNQCKKIVDDEVANMPKELSRDTLTKQKETLLTLLKDILDSEELDDCRESLIFDKTRRIINEIEKE